MKPINPAIEPQTLRGRKKRAGRRSTPAAAGAVAGPRPQLRIVPSPLERWRRGELASEDFVSDLCDQLAEVRVMLEPLQAAEKQLRGQLSQVVMELGGKVLVEDFGLLQITQPGQSVSYDRAGLDNLVQELLARGHTEIATAISQLRQTGIRPGGLRIVPAKTYNYY
jgi:hypothetical protein